MTPEIAFQLGSIAAIVTQGSVKSLGLAPGKRAIALFKATSVIVAGLSTLRARFFNAVIVTVADALPAGIVICPKMPPKL